MAEYIVTNPSGARVYEKFVNGVLKDPVAKANYGTEIEVTADLGKAYQVIFWKGNYVAHADLAPLTVEPPVESEYILHVVNGVERKFVLE